MQHIGIYPDPELDKSNSNRDQIHSFIHSLTHNNFSNNFSGTKML